MEQPWLRILMICMHSKYNAENYDILDHTNFDGHRDGNSLNTNQNIENSFDMDGNLNFRG